MTSTHVEVLIVGAGLSGIGAAARLMRDHPDLSLVILEARERLGGTWDLFRYPGVRSDSDMFTLGYDFKPWVGEKALADGASIRAYVEETAREHDLLDRIRYAHRVTSADWDSATRRWTVEVLTGAGATTYTTGFLFCCSGYYDYASGYRPAFPGEESFTGTWVHPQSWPSRLDYAGARVAVIGSGATAITLVPSLAESAAHVTMVQRTPTYVISLAAEDRLAARLRRVVPPMTAYRLIRWRNVLQQMLFFQASRRFPTLVKRLVRRLTRQQLPNVDVDLHFAPPYDPWDQRFCVIPNGDLFEALRSGRASVETGEIETFTATGMRLRDGTQIDADIVVTATGLTLLAFGGIQFRVDGQTVDLSEAMAYRGLMLTGLPNFAYTVGYTNASWTLKADLVAGFVSRVVAKLRTEGLARVEVVPDPSVATRPFMDLDAGYVRRAADALPKQGDRSPWRARQNYLYDRIAVGRADLGDPNLRWS